MTMMNEDAVAAAPIAPDQQHEEAAQVEKQKPEMTEEDKLVRVLLHDERSCIFETRVERASLCRDRGSLEFKQKNIRAAIEWYERALFHVEFDEGTWHFEFMDKHRDLVNQVRLPVHLNLAMCFLHDDDGDDAKTQNLAKVIEQSEAVLVIDPKNSKALYRCGRAHLLNDNLDGARKKLTLAALSQPNDRTIREALQLLAEKSAAHRAKEKETWGGRLLDPKSETTTNSSDSDKEKTSGPVSSSTTTTSSTATVASSWVTPLVVLLVAMLVGLGVMLLR